jgi:hypothetical protein
LIVYPIEGKCPPITINLEQGTFGASRNRLCRRLLYWRWPWLLRYSDSRRGWLSCRYPFPRDFTWLATNPTAINRCSIPVLNGQIGNAVKLAFSPAQRSLDLVATGRSFRELATKTEHVGMIGRSLSHSAQAHGSGFAKLALAMADVTATYIGQ